MKRYVLGLVFLVVTATGCFKSQEEENVCDTYDPCKVVVSASELAQVQNYLAEKGITDAVKHCSGIYYKIINEGTGAAPGVCSAITVRYTGKLANGTGFDSTDSTETYTEYLINLIPGWKNTLPLIKKNGSIQLFIPPSLGYGYRDAGNIPAGSLLIFDVELLNIQ